MTPIKLSAFIFLPLLLILISPGQCMPSPKRGNSTANEGPPSCECCLEDSYTKVCNGTIFTGEWGEGIGCPLAENWAKEDRHCPLLPLHEAAATGNLAKVKVLLARKVADVNQPDAWRKTALHYAVEGGRKEVVKFLLDNGAKVDPVEPQLGTPLYCAVHDGFGEIVEILLKHGANANVHSKWTLKTPLHMMAMDGNLGVVKMLLDHGANIEAKDINGETPLHCAIVSGNEQLVQLLLESGAKVSTKIGGEGGQQMTPLAYAVGLGKVPIVRALLAHASKEVVNGQDEEGQTALSNAAYDNKTAIVGLLLEYGADPNLADFKGNTPMHWAAMHGFMQIARNLLTHGANLGAENANGDMPIHTAINNGQRQLVQLLIEADKMNALMENGMGQSPLELAVLNGQKGLAEDLIRAGADVDLQSIEMARKFKRRDIEDLLVNGTTKAR